MEYSKEQGVWDMSSSTLILPQCTSMRGLRVSIRWYLGSLKGWLGGAGTWLSLKIVGPKIGGLDSDPK